MLCADSLAIQHTRAPAESSLEAAVSCGLEEQAAGCGVGARLAATQEAPVAVVPPVQAQRLQPDLRALRLCRKQRRCALVPATVQLDSRLAARAIMIGRFVVGSWEGGASASVRLTHNFPADPSACCMALSC